GATAVGAVFLVSAAFDATIHPMLGRWTDRSGYRPPVRAGILGSIGILLVLSEASSPWLLGILVILAAGAFNATLVPGSTLFSRGTEKAGVEQAIAFGLTNVAWASGYAIGAPLAGLLAEFGGDSLSYLFLVGVSVITLISLGRRAEKNPS
ncbi:MAG: MFS transporter, partial [Rubrobacteraceae bacterium]